MKLTIQLPFHLDCYTIETECQEIIRTLRRTYGVYCRTAADEDSAEYRIVETDSGCRILHRGQVIPTDNPVQHLHNAMFTGRKIVPGIFALHAGGVSRGNKAYIFCAPTTTGKTTLTAYLAERGMAYISDDCVFINMHDFTVSPCHMPIHLREGGYTVLREHGLSPNPIEQAGERYVYTPRKLSPAKMEIGKILFLTRTSDTNAVHPLSKPEALHRLMLSPITIYPITKEYLLFLHKLIPYCYDVKYCDMTFVLHQLESE